MGEAAARFMFAYGVLAGACVVGIAATSLNPPPQPPPSQFQEQVRAALARAGDEDFERIKRHIMLRASDGIQVDSTQHTWEAPNDIKSPCLSDGMVARLKRELGVDVTSRDGRPACNCVLKWG